MKRAALAWPLAASLVTQAALAQPTAEPPANAPASVEAVAAPEGAAAPGAARAPAVATAPEVTAAPEVTTAPAEAGGLPADGADDSFVTDAGSGGGGGDESPKVELYGFADFSYLHPLSSQDQTLTHYIGPYPRFYVGHLNLYMSSTLGESWRSLAEVRFTYSPTGDEDTPAPDGSFPITDSSTYDYAELQRTFSWGGIEVQRAWLEYQPFDFLAIRGGHWLTPYGYWNDDHGSPTIITVHKPFAISEAYFPEHQTGLVAHGKYFIGPTALGYALTLSNGRGPFDTFRDLDGNKAVGGRLYVETPAIGNLTIGVDAYRGRFTASTKRYRVDVSNPEQPVAQLYRETDVAYDELSLGADVRFLWQGLHVQGEVMVNDAAYDEEHRPRAGGFDPRPAFTADYRRLGAYLLLGYRTPWLSIMPYVMGEYASFANSDQAPPVWAWSAGVNVRPTANVVLKAELAIADFVGVGSTGLGTEDLPYFGAQVAWAF